MRCPTLPALLISSLLAACDFIPQLSPSTDWVNAKDTNPAQPNCASCHQFLLNDGNHEYHLFSSDVQGKMRGAAGLNNQVTCLDCHNSAIAHFAINTSVGVTYRPLPDYAVDTTRGTALATEIDALIAAYSRRHEMVQWKTGPNHFDYKVDVDFPPNNMVAGRSLASVYNPKSLSCSAITCHESKNDTYRWNERSD